MNSEGLKETEIGVIPEDWEVHVLSDVIDVNPKRPVKKGEKVKFVSMPYLKEFEKKIQNYELRRYSGGSRFKNGDTIVARITPSLENGKTAYVDILDENEIAAGSTEFIVLSPKKGTTTSHFIYYLSRSPKIRQRLIKSMTGTSGRQRVENDVFNHINVPIPHLNEQKSIENFLSSLDNKIFLNHQINQTLEKLGYNLFRHWFVHFEFPDKNGQPYKSSGGDMADSKLGEIPVGWEVGKLKDLGRIVCGKTPPKSKKEYFGGEIPFIKIPDMHDQTFVVKTEDSLTHEGKKFQENKTLPANSVCVSCIATVGLVCITPKDSQTNQQINSIIPKNQFSTPYLYYTMSKMKDFIEILASGGSATLNLNTNNFSKIDILIPDEEVLQKYSRIVKPLFDHILNNLNQIENLSQIRDSLLPKLMSGKIRVNALEEAIAK